MKENKHTFAIAAYKESPYLETAIKSVMSQTVKSDVYIVTGTPNGFIDSLAQAYNISVIINAAKDAQTAAGNWNFALKNAKTDFVTIVHQDDFYEPTYTEKILKKTEGKDPIIIFPEYFEVRNEKRVYKNKILKVKRMMNIGFRLFPRSKFIRKRLLSLGNPICCPAVAFSKKAYTDFEFDDSFIGGCFDWDAWIRLSELDGDFLYVKEPLVGHRIHDETLTSHSIANNERGDDELVIFKKMWPDWIAKVLYKKYCKAAQSNDL